MSCGKTTARFILIFINVLFMLAGVALIAAGTIVRLNAFHNVTEANFDGSGLTPAEQSDIKAWIKMSSISLIVFGCAVFITSFLGCCGASKINRCMLGMYFAIVGVILIGQLVLGGYIISHKTSLDSEMHQFVNGTFTRNQNMFESICDANGENGETICAANTVACGDCVTDVFNKNVLLGGIVLLSICFVEFLCLVSSCCLFVAAKHTEEDVGLLAAGGYKNYHHP